MEQHGANGRNYTTLVPVPVPGTSEPLMAVQQDGTEWVSGRHVCSTLGIDWKSQQRKLNGKSWAVMVMSTTTAADGSPVDPPHEQGRWVD